MSKNSLCLTLTDVGTKLKGEKDLIRPVPTTMVHNLYETAMYQVITNSLVP